jgi:hypothetical protein
MENTYNRLFEKESKSELDETKKNSELNYEKLAYEKSLEPDMTLSATLNSYQVQTQ